MLDIETRSLTDPLYATADKTWITDPSIGYFNVSLLQSPYGCTTSYNRFDLFDIITALGGLLSVIAYLVDYFISSYQEFTLDKSMMKRLYTEEKEPYQKYEKESANDGSDDQGDKKARRSDKDEFLYRI